MPRVLAAVLLAVAFVAADPARAEAAPVKLRRTYVRVDPPPPASPARLRKTGGARGVIYLNRCAASCTLSPGTDDSRADRSSLLKSTVTVPAFDKGDQAWREVVDCVARLYAPYNIRVTDQDPGAAEHHEAIVAGDPGAAGFPVDFGGIAPFACAEIRNAITYSFANVWPSALDVCETVAQESAHAFGLDHVLLCTDPMTYLPACGPRRFQDVDALCGETEAHACACGGGATQNSHKTLLDVFGPGDAAEPASCTSDTGCGGESCIGGRCVTPSGRPGGLGESCTADPDCGGSACSSVGNADRVCAARCDLSAPDCPSGSRCTDSASGPVCWSSGGCSAGGGASMSGLVLAALAALALRRRR